MRHGNFIACLLAAIIFIGNPASACATTVVEFRKLDKSSQFAIYKKVVDLRVQQLEQYGDSDLARQIADYFLKYAGGKSEAPGHHEFEVNVDAIMHPELSKSTYDPTKVDVEALLTRIIKNDYDDLRAKKKS